MRVRNAPLIEADISSLAWNKMDGLIPAVVQDSRTSHVLMLGYMDRAALLATLSTGFATFFSRSKQRLWQKGESSGNSLAVTGVFSDCDDDALLVKAMPSGPTCHLGSTSCFGGDPEIIFSLEHLAKIVRERAHDGDETSYTARLLAEGPLRIAQKVGEEGVEVALAAVARDAAGCAEVVADLVYHLTVLMEAKGFSWEDVTTKLRARHRS